MYNHQKLILLLEELQSYWPDASFFLHACKNQHPALPTNHLLNSVLEAIKDSISCCKDIKKLKKMQQIEKQLTLLHSKEKFNEIIQGIIHSKEKFNE